MAMRLRRVELVIIGVTLAFACFIGGYFTGRTTGVVNITPVVSSQADLQSAAVGAAPAAINPARDTRESMATTGTLDTGAVSQSSPEIPAPANAQGNAQGNANNATEQVGAQKSDGRININSASRTELEDLPGIGPALSSRIVDYRNNNGPFSTIEELKKVSGIGDKKFEAIKDKVTI